MVNRFAQGLLTEVDLLAWYDELDVAEKRDLFMALRTAVHESHPLPIEVEEGLDRAGLRRTFTPCVLLQRFSFKVALAKILRLPENEWRKSLLALIHVFAVADARRRSTECRGGCSHDWHHLRQEWTLPTKRPSRGPTRG